MALGNTSSGFHDAGAYMVSAMPWVTGSVATTTTPQRISFPKVTRFVCVFSQAGDARVGFSVNGVNGTNFFRVPSGSAVQLDIRVNEIYVRSATGTGEVDIFGGLTLISANSTGFLTGSTAFTGSSPGSGWQGVG